MKNTGGVVATIVVGIVGAVVGGFIGTQLGPGTVTGFNLISTVLATIGPVLLLLAWKYASGDGGNASASLRVSGQGSSPA